MKTIFESILYEVVKQSKSIDLEIAYDIAKIMIKNLDLQFVDPYTIKPNQIIIKSCGIPVGSIRRKETNVSDIDIFTTKEIDAYTIEKTEGFIKWLEKGRKKLSFLFYCKKHNITVQIEFYINKDSRSFGSMLLHTTGPSQYNIYLRKLAKDQNLLLNQNGVFNNKEQLAGETEVSCYKVLKSKQFPDGKEWKAPWDRKE